MPKNKKIAPSVMCAPLFALEDCLRELEENHVELIHIDIMDGSFVPNITLGFDLVNSVKKITDIPLDVHMMVNQPSRFIPMAMYTAFLTI